MTDSSSQSRDPLDAKVDRSWLPSNVHAPPTRALGTASLRYASLVVGFVLSVVIARALGPEGRGEYYYPILAVLTLQALMHLSLEPANLLLLTERRVPLGALVAQSGMFAVLAGTLGIAIGVTAWLVFRNSLGDGVPSIHFALALAPLPMMLHTLYLMGLLLLQGRAVAIQTIALVGSIVQLGLLGLLLLTSRATLTVSSVLALNSLTLMLVWGLAARTMNTLVPVWPRWDTDVAVSALRFGSRLHAGTVLFFLANRLDAYLVKQFLGLTALGYYSLAVALADLVTVAADAVVAASVVPRQAGLPLRDAGQLTAKACRVTFALAALLSLGLAVAAYPLVIVAYGKQFVPLILPLLLLLPGVTVLAMARPLGYYLLRVDRPLRIALVVAAGGVASLSLNMALIPRLGVAGAALATSLCNGGLVLFFVTWFCRYSGIPVGEVLWLRAEDVASVWKAWRLSRRT